MKALDKSLFSAALLGVIITAPAAANTLVVSGTINKLAGGTTFDAWKINMTVPGNFTVDVAAYEASQSSTATAGYSTSDINGDGELTWLDPDTYFYKDTGLPIAASDALVRCDDINNNCAVYQNGLSASTSPVQVSSLTQAQGSADGSVHFRRDPAYNATAAAGGYLFLIADYRLDSAEAAGGINANDTFSPPSGFVNPITDHADYRVAFSSNTLNFSLSGNTITVSSVPVPAAVWLFGSALAGMGIIGRRRERAA